MPVLRLLLLAACVALLPSCREAEPPRPAEPRVLFVGVDGATWKVMGPMMGRGELPAFRRLMEQGAYMLDFGTMETTFSPVVWTTVATGRAPQDHGVQSFTIDLPNGRKIPVTSSVRKARAVWELASRRGVSVGVAGWWASWPAEEVRGWVISDHANPAFSELLFEDRNYWTADRKKLESLQRDVYPADIAPVLARHWISREEFPWEELQGRGGFTDAQVQAVRAAPWNQRNVHSWLKTFFRVDYPLFRASMDLMRERPTDLWMLYLRGPDPVQHYGWDLVEPERFAAAPPHLERDRGLVEGVYRYVDTFLAEILEARPADSWLIVASDHGAEPSAHAMDPAKMLRPGEHSTDSKGVLFLLGPDVRRGHRLTRGNPYDLMPTLAWLLGLPLSDELPGRPLIEAFTDELAKSLPVRSVPSYGARPTGPLLASPSDEEMIRSLKNLGYIQ